MKSYNFHLISLLAAVLFFSVLCPQKTHAALTKQLSYQGRLQNASGQPVANGTYSIVFSIYNVSSGGSALWTEMQNVSVDSGGFSAYLGSVTPLTLPFNEDYYLGIKVGSDPEMTPRMKLAVVGTAAFALESDKLQGKAASDFALSTHTHTVSVGTSEITDGSITASDIDATAVQKRVTGTCAGQVMVAINQDGTVTCEADDAGGGGGGTPASTVTSVGASNVVGTSTNYAREDHVHNIPAGLITNTEISSSAAIAKSKLNLSNSILFSDIASNSCSSGQIVEYNGTAWVCGTDDTTGGGAVVNNPGATQTIIAGNSSTTPLALKAASAPTAAMFDVQDFSGITQLKVAPSGNLLVGNPVQVAPKLSVESAGTDPTIAIKHTGSGTALDVWQAGSGMGVVVSLAAGNTNPLYDGDTSGTGNLLQLSVGGINKFVVSNSGQITTGGMSNAVITNPSGNQTITAGGPALTPLTVKAASAPTMDIFHVEDNAATPLLAVNNTGNLLVGNPATTTAKVSAEEAGTANYGGYFKIGNASNSNDAVYGSTNGAGVAVSGVTSGAGVAVSGLTTGTGKAGVFQISNAGSTNNPVYAETNGTGALFLGNATGAGNLFKLQQSSVDKFVVDNLADINIIKAGTSLINVSDGANTVLNITNAGAGTASLQVEGATVLTSANGVITNPGAAQTILPTADVVPLILKDDAAATANLFDIQNNGGTTLLKVNPSGNLLVGNPTITLAKVSAYETGSGNYAGVFSINNAGNPNAAILGTTNGTGEAVYANSTGSGAAVHGYATGTGTAGYFQTNNAGNTSPVILGDTNGTGNLLQLQQGGVNKFVVDNTGAITVGGAANTVKNNPTSTQTILAGNATTTPLVVKAASSPSANIFDVQNNAASSLLTVNSAGNVGIGTAAPGGVLTVASGRGQFINNTVPSSGTGVEIGYDTTNDWGVIDAYARGVGQKPLHLQNDAVVITNTGNVLVGNPAITTAKVSAEETGTGNNAGYFKISNAGNTNDAVYGYTTGSGAAIFGYGAGSGNAVYGYVSSTGKAGFFDIQNAVNSASVIVGNTTGTGNLLQLQQSYTDKFVVSNAGSVLLDGNANPSIKASGATPNLILDADGTGASIVKVKNSTSPGNVLFQTEGAITAFNGTNAVPVSSGATQELIQKGNACEAIATNGTISVTFTPAFSATPTVTFGQTGGTTAPAAISAKNSSSFTVSGFETGGTSECIDWIAIGNK